MRSQSGWHNLRLSRLIVGRLFEHTTVLKSTHLASPHIFAWILVTLVLVTAGPPAKCSVCDSHPRTHTASTLLGGTIPSRSKFYTICTACAFFLFSSHFVLSSLVLARKYHFHITLLTGLYILYLRKHLFLVQYVR